jgi:hypothetical protein
MKRNEEFPVLSSIAALLNWLGWIVAGGGVIVAILGIPKFVQKGAFGGTQSSTGVLYIILGVFIIVFGICVVMAAEWTGVLFAIEKNGRGVAQYIPSPRRDTMDMVDSDSVTDPPPEKTVRSVVPCPHCGTENAIRYLDPGDEGRCRECDAPFVVPESSESYAPSDTDETEEA